MQAIAKKICRHWLLSLPVLLAACGGSGSSSTSAGDGSSSSTGSSNQTSTSPMGTAAAARLLMQASMGTTLSDLNAAAGESYDGWFAVQAAAPPSLELPRVPDATASRQSAWWYNAVNGSDQLRQRMAFALSEILVVSDIDAALAGRGQALASYYDLLTTNALGNYRTLLGAVSQSPVMGKYLTFFRNDVPDPETGVQPDENYAREIMQLFTIGLWQLNPDGTQKLDAGGAPISTYAQADVSNLAKVFTGWGSHPVGGDTGAHAWASDDDLFHPMACYPQHHDSAAKTIVGGVAIPAGGSCQSDLATALDTLVNHPNTAPFISKQLIQRLVTSNPSPEYVARVAAVFASNAQGLRGDLLAVAKAILTDPEAVALGTTAGAGRLREPMLRLTALWRTFSAAQSDGTISVNITNDAIGNFGEDSLDSPTVFNFFTPTYQRAGPLATAGLVVPEFQITNENTIVQTANALESQAYSFVSADGVVSTGSGGGPAANEMLLHTAAWEGYAADAGTLVSQLELVFMPGQMPAAMRSTLVDYVSSIPAADPASRVIEAASLLVDSPQYSVQR